MCLSSDGRDFTILVTRMHQENELALGALSCALMLAVLYFDTRSRVTDDLPMKIRAAAETREVGRLPTERDGVASLRLIQNCAASHALRIRSIQPHAVGFRLRLFCVSNGHWA